MSYWIYVRRQRGSARSPRFNYLLLLRIPTIMPSCQRMPVTSRHKGRGKPKSKDAESKIYNDEAAGHLKSGNPLKALHAYTKALELNPNDKNALVARSKCYLLLGEPHLALQDAETALKGDKTFIRALFQKAEALYYLGDFEHSLMYFHRGQRLRPELEGFRLGVQKAQQAIENTIGTKPMKNVKIEEPLVEESKSMNASCEKIASTGKSRKEPSENSKHARNLLGELYIDKEYLEQLLKNPDINCVNQEGPNSIAAQAQEGIAFLNNREEFWRQQRASTNLHKKGKKRS